MFPKKPILLFLLAAVPLLFLSGQAPSPDIKEIISVEKTPAAERALRERDFDLLMEWEGRIYALAGPAELDTLARLRIPYQFETHKFSPQIPGRTVLQDGMNGEYHSYLELEKDLLALEKTYPQQAKVYAIGSSLEQRKIYAIKISDNAASDEPEAEVLFLGCHHAREWISVEVPFFLAKYLLEHYSDPDVKSLVDRSEIWIVPMVNPDGLEYTIHHYRYWRKNRRLNADGSYGIDLNRNFGWNWGYDNTGSSPNPASEVYRGTAAFSEPETQAVRGLFLQHAFQAMISFHSFAQVILYPWGYTTTPADQDALLNQIAAAMAQRIRQVNGRSYVFGGAGSVLYVTNGDITDWTYGLAGIPSYTIELPPVDELRGGFFNAETDIQPIFRENLPAMLYLVDWAIQTSGIGAAEPLGKKPATSPEARKKILQKD